MNERHDRLLTYAQSKYVGLCTKIYKDAATHVHKTMRMTGSSATMFICVQVGYILESSVARNFFSALFSASLLIAAK